ncbi:hypothetical protein QTT33_004479 [Salmonella enterica]|nr:hypothetical protein [Salmonella enterica]
MAEFTTRLWAVAQDDVWTRWAPEFSRWDKYSEKRAFICADPATGEACYYVDPDGSVHWRNVDQNINKAFPGISAKMIIASGL